MSQQQRRLKSKGWCQFAVIGCIALALAVIGLCVAGFMYFRKPAPVVTGTPSGPVVVATRTASVSTTSTVPSPAETLTPTPAQVMTPTPFAVDWNGNLKRGSDRKVPVKVDGKGTCYVAALDLAKILTPKEYEQVHRRGATLLFGDREVGQVIKGGDADDDVPVTQLFAAMDMKITLDKGALEARISSLEVKTSK